MAMMHQASQLVIHGRDGWTWRKSNVEYQIDAGWLLVRDAQRRQVFVAAFKDVHFIEVSWPEEG